jgi:hypothetical protein
MKRYTGVVLQVMLNVAGMTEKGQRQKRPVWLIMAGLFTLAFASFWAPVGAQASPFDCLINPPPPTVECTADSSEVKGTNGDDVIDCDETGPHSVKARSGGDCVATGSDDDVIDAGPGDDFIADEGGNNKINGGEGDDAIFFNSTGAKQNNVQGGKGDDFIFDVCAFSGVNCGKDRIRGGEGDDIIVGGGNDDFITGDDGDDELDGADGNDCLDGGDGIDECDGGDGDDCCRNCETEISCDEPGTGVCVGDLQKACKF